jgi:hypothetical protein
MSEIEGEPTPTYSADEGDILEQATPVPEDDDEEYPYAAEEDEEAGPEYDDPELDEA